MSSTYLSLAYIYTYIYTHNSLICGKTVCLTFKKYTFASENMYTYKLNIYDWDMCFFIYVDAI